MTSPSRFAALFVSFAAACAAPSAPTEDPGTQPGEPYRVLVRTWHSPLGLTVATYGLAIDGIPIYGHHEVEVSDPAGALVHRAGTGDAVLAELHARGPTAWASWQHPRAGLAPRAHVDPLVHVDERAVWHYRAGTLVAAVETERADLTAATPIGELAVTDAQTGATLTRHSMVYELGGHPQAPDYLVYANPDGRPFTSPLGNTSPHPTGVPDGSVPPPAAQSVHAQRTARYALHDPWLPAGATQTSGNNVMAFFDSLIKADGTMGDFGDENGNDTPEYGPFPDDVGFDFFAHPTAGHFAFPYDPTDTVDEYYQDQFFPGDPAPFPDVNDPALNAKITETFYAANWLHDYFYRAGFDEVAGVGQVSNFGRGGIEGDPLLIHAGFFGTVTLAAHDGQTSVLDLGLNSRSASRRDQGMDFSTMSHEWGHYMIARLVGGADDALGNEQGGALHEGIADFISVLVNYNDGDDPHAAFAVGAYGNLDYIERRPTLPPEEAPADAMYFGIRRYPYSLDPNKNPLTLRHLAEPPPTSHPYYNWKGRGPLLSEVHTAGEVFSEALFACFGNIVLAHPHGPPDRARDLMAQYLVAGLVAFPDRPSLLDARDAILAAIRAAGSHGDYVACRNGFAAHGMGAGALGPDREFGSQDEFPPPDYDPADITESYVSADRALHVANATLTTGPATAIQVTVRNSGFVDLHHTTVAIRPAVPAAVSFPAGKRAELPAIVPEDVGVASIAVVVNACALPPDPAQPGSRSFDYTVDVSSPGLHETAGFHTSLIAACP